MVERSDEDEMEKLFRQRVGEEYLQAQARRERTVAEALAYVKANDRDPGCYITAARSYKQLGRLNEALEILRQGIGLCAPSVPLFEYYIERLEKCNRTEEAIAVARKAALLFPGELIFPLREALILPILYGSRAQMDHYRRRFTAGLRRIIREIPLDTPLERRRALMAIGQSSNKYLPYQGENDCELQSLYGAWVQRVMEANYPQRAQPNPMPPVDGKIRVGYVTAFSARFLNMSAGKLFGGWIQEHDRRQFDVFAYHADHRAGMTAHQLRRWNVDFSQLSGQVDEIADAILRNRLHVLVYLDFGIHPRMAQLAALRPAPVQCVTWDFPFTSGIPAIDYFLSSNLMEPRDTTGHYSEELVKLPGVGVCFTKPVIPTVILSKKRADFGLRDDAVVYLSCQSIFKYSPEQDQLIARIARRVPNSQFVFLIANDIVGDDIRARMNEAFAAALLRADNHCVWLAEMAVLDFWNLHRIADVSLDTLGWSGGVTTLEALACELPVVTLPGMLMRSRHSYAILTQLGVTETIARDEEDYIEIAVRLGLDHQWRQSIVDRTVSGYPNLYSDTRSVRALEGFYRHAVQKRQSVES